MFDIFHVAPRFICAFSIRRKNFTKYAVQEIGKFVHENQSGKEASGNRLKFNSNKQLLCEFISWIKEHQKSRTQYAWGHNSDSALFV